MLSWNVLWKQNMDDLFYLKNSKDSIILKQQIKASFDTRYS
jgi:hypothetical protein